MLMRMNDGLYQQKYKHNEQYAKGDANAHTILFALGHVTAVTDPACSAGIGHLLHEAAAQIVIDRSNIVQFFLSPWALVHRAFIFGYTLTFPGFLIALPIHLLAVRRI